MDINAYEILLKIMKKDYFLDMIEFIKKNNDSATEELIREYCDFIYVIGVSKAFRENCLNEEMKLKIKQISDIDKFIKTYYEYIKVVIEFCANSSSKCSGEYLYTELDDGVYPYDLK